MIELEEQAVYCLQAWSGAGIVQRDGTPESPVAGGHEDFGFFRVLKHLIGEVKEAFEPVEAVGFVEGEATGDLPPVEGGGGEAKHGPKSFLTDAQTLGEVREEGGLQGKARDTKTA
jgi:hypothetical protein